MKTLEIIDKTQEYLDYVREHILNVERAWNQIQDKCSDMFFVKNLVYYSRIKEDVCSHDLSKLSEKEFVQYRKVFYPTKFETKPSLTEAWDHHKKENNHHWENWTKKNECRFYLECCCIHMVIDWVAMSYKFGDTAQEYYEKNKKNMNLPDWSEKIIYEIFERLYNND